MQIFHDICTCIQNLTKMLSVGLTHTSVVTVEERHTALFVGSGDMNVLATPVMTALMENAAMLSVADFLDEGEATVGAHIETSHLRPTTIGKTVEAVATLVKIDGKKLYFKIEARQGDLVIGSGTHLRFVVNKERFSSQAGL